MLSVIRNEELYKKLEELRNIAMKILISYDEDDTSTLKSYLSDLEISYEKIKIYVFV